MGRAASWALSIRMATTGHESRSRNPQDIERSTVETRRWEYKARGMSEPILDLMLLEHRSLSDEGDCQKWELRLSRS